MNRPKNTEIMAFRVDEELAERIFYYCERLALDKTSLLKMCVKLMLDKLDKQGGDIIFKEPEIVEKSNLVDSQKDNGKYEQE